MKNVNTLNPRLSNLHLKPFPKNTRYLVGKTGLIVDSETGEVLNPHLTGGGAGRKYERVILKADDYRMFMYVHRAVAITYLGDNSGTDLVVHHKDNNPHNNCLDNLEWTTQKINVGLSKRNGRQDKLSPQIVAEIRVLLDNNFKHDMIQKLYKVGHMAIWRIKTGQTYNTKEYTRAYENFKDTSIKLF